MPHVLYYRYSKGNEVDNMTKITKALARKLYDEGKPVRLVASKMNPDLFSSPIDRKVCGVDFENVVNAFRYYNCNAECGKRVCYYTYD